MANAAAKPIRVTMFGDAIAPVPRPKVRTDPDEAPLRNAVHVWCQGRVTFHRTTEHTCILHCIKCGLRVAFPFGINTFAQLRHYKVEYNAANVQSEQ